MSRSRCRSTYRIAATSPSEANECHVHSTTSRPPSFLTLSDRLGSGTQSVNHAGERIANVGRPPTNLAMNPGRRR